MNSQSNNGRNETQPKMGGMMRGMGMGGGMGGGHGRMAPAEKPRDFKKTWLKLLRYIKPYLAIMIFALILAIVGAVFTVIGPDKLKEMTNIITEGIMGDIDLNAIGKIGIFLAVIYGLSFIFTYLQSYIMASVAQKISKNMRSQVSEKINKLPLKYFDSTSYGNILSRLTNDVDMVGQTFSQSLGTFVSSATLFIGSVVMMFVTSIPMALAALASVAIGFIAIMLITKRSQKYFIKRQIQLGNINGHIEEMYSGHIIVKAYNGEKEAKETFDKINRKLERSTRRSRFLSGMMMPIMNFIGNFSYVVVCVLGAVLVINGSIEFGVIVAFMVYVRLFTRPLQQFAQVATQLQSTAASSERVFEILEEQEMNDESNKVIELTEVKGQVDFEHVRFGYDPNKIIINDFSAQAKPGQKIAIVGPTGAGKTTLVNLLMRFYELNDGVIKIDGIPTVDMTRENVHGLFGMVLQDTWLFEGTIRENIVYAKEGVTDEQVKEAAKAVGLHHFIRSLPDGYNTVLNESASLSDGQKQLITIARAMVDNAPMLILDEATSSVDTRTEILIQQAMDRLMAGRTSFVIAHRLSTIKNADLILVMNEGDIIESGTHEELLAKNGFYAELYNSQFDRIS